MMLARPTAPLAVSMGDPAGIGLEIACKAWARRREEELPPFVLIADMDAVARAAALVGAPVPCRATQTPAEASQDFDDALPVLHEASPRQERWGAPDPNLADSILGAIRSGAALARVGACAGLVTLPVSKKPLYEAGFRFPGQTEFVASLVEDVAFAGARGPVMMLAGESLRVAQVTVHSPLKDAIAALSSARVAHVARVCAEALRRDFGIAQPRLALAGLNPHAGEGGRLGREEINLLAPTAAALRAEGVDITDPQPPDSMFHAQARASYDAAICLYHDQGLIPLKTLHFWDGVNVTLGLPIIRTSPDHGTGYDIAGKGLARPDSFIAALRLAARMAQTRRGAA